jgi:AP-3 complex subunit mu
VVPINVRHSIQFREGSNGRFEVTIGPRAGLGKIVENASISAEMPKSVLNMTLTASQGKYTFDPVKKSLIWEIGRIDPAKPPSLRGNVRFFSSELNK